MVKKLLIIHLLVLVSFLPVSAQENKKVRMPAVSGDVRGFYPATPSKLQAAVTSFLGAAEKKPVNGTPFAIIVPHAGYVYSGQTAAWGFRQIENVKPEVVFIIGGSHNWHFEGASVPDYSFYKTPLGSVPVNQQVIETLSRQNSLIKQNVTFPAGQSFFGKGTDTSIHAVEHSLEVEIPFLQTIYRDFTIVPVLFGTKDLAVCKSVGTTIGNYCKNNPGCIIVCSTDLTHYPPYEAANSIDRKTLALITAMDLDKLNTFVRSFPMRNTP